MNDNNILDQLKLFAIDHDLPQTDMALFGVSCPYCGKTDRIKPLEHPEALNHGFNATDLAVYARLWAHLNGSNGSLGVCKFCQNPLRLGENGQAESLIK